MITNKTRPALILAGLIVGGIAVAAAFVPSAEKTPVTGREPSLPESVSAALIVTGFLRGEASKTWTNAVVTAIGEYAAFYGDTPLGLIALRESSKLPAERAFEAASVEAIIQAAKARDLYRWDVLRSSAV